MSDDLSETLYYTKEEIDYLCKAIQQVKSMLA